MAKEPKTIRTTMTSKQRNLSAIFLVLWIASLALTAVFPKNNSVWLIVLRVVVVFLTGISAGLFISTFKKLK